MKRFLAFAAFAAIAATLTGTANAASFKGVVVAKDAKRKALVTASKGAVRTVRAPSRFARVKVGQRIAVDARIRPDGTFNARSLRVIGRSGKARFRAVVVKGQRTRLIITAGSSVFTLRLTGLRTSSAAPDGKLEAGDKVSVDADVDGGKLEAGSGDVDEIGHASVLELEGIFLNATKDGFDLAVVHRGLVHVAVPEGKIVPPFKPGDQIEVLVRVGDDGSFTFMKGRQDERDYGKGKDRGEYMAEGKLAGKSPLSVSVRGEKGTLTCAIPAGLDMSFFRIGERAKLICVSRDGDLVMTKLKTENGYLSGDGSGELHTYGVLTAMSAESIKVRREDTTLTTCLFRSPVDMSLFRLGEKVKLRCRLEVTKWVFGSLWGENASIDEEGRVEMYAHGALQPRSGADVVVRRADGTFFGCGAPAELDLSLFRASEPVKLHCRVEGGMKTLLSVHGERYTLGADGSAELYAHGSLSAKSGDSLTVTAEDSSAFTCAFPAGLDLAAFPLGASVRVHCQRIAGAWQLRYVKSETAVVEVKR
jgi:hypothetical protein